VPLPQQMAAQKGRRVMGDQIKDGGPAFPGGVLPAHPEHPNGMTLRDWFAGQALANLVDPASPEAMANFAYKIADAMLEARGK